MWFLGGREEEACRRGRLNVCRLACCSLGSKPIFLIPQMFVGRTRRRASSVKESPGMETPRRLLPKRPMAKSRRTISCLWRTASRSSPRPPTPPWEVPLPAATRWSWWRSTGTSCETPCRARVTSPPACPLCVKTTPRAPRNL